MSTLVFVGGGPRTTGILLRLAANAGGEDNAVSAIHVIDPYPAGGGRIWRAEQSALLWMNSMAQDVTIFADESVEMDGPVIDGPRLDEWVLGIGREQVIAAGLEAELKGFSGTSFASRRLQSLYLGWAFAEAVRRLAHLPTPIPVTVHRELAVELIDIGAEQLIRLESGAVLSADKVVLCQGHFDLQKSAESAALSSIAATEGLTYVPAGFTADLDLSVLKPGEPVIVRGFGLAFIDAMILLAEARGGQYVTHEGQLEYLPSGNEPELWVGSRRGVPYLPKLNYSVPLGDIGPKFIDDASLAAFNNFTLDFHAHILPLLKWNLTFAHYEHLATHYPERVKVSWEELSAQLHRLLPVELDGDLTDIGAFIERAIPDPGDRFDFEYLNNPLQDLLATSQVNAEAEIAAYIALRTARASDPRFSMDQAVFVVLLKFYFRVHELGQAGRFSASDLRENIDKKLHGLFSYIASGPPSCRLEQLLALYRAGIVHFVGPNMEVSVEDGTFIATSPASPDAVRTDALIDAYLASDSAAAADDVLLQRLLNAGELMVDSLDPQGVGKFLVDSLGRAITTNGVSHPSRYVLGSFASGGGSEAPFSRPGTNAPGFRRADQLARRLLGLSGNFSDQAELALYSRNPD